MKTGLLLLQSALRSGAASWASSSGRKAAGAAFIAAAGVGVGVGITETRSSSAMCSAASSETTATNGASAAAAARLQAIHDKRKSIDEPMKTPDHNPLLPFPESSLRHDTYNGVTLDLLTLASSERFATSAMLTDATAFGDSLGQALEIWASEGRKGIWIKVPTSHSHLIAPACNLHGFDFQHGEPGFCVLTKWLPKETASRLPNGPTHQVGIGALVIHPLTGKMLAVQERTGPAAARKLWKMPTGLTDPGEDIATAAVRELKEETGLDCVFDKIICFRQAHGGLFNRSDMFFVCLCKLHPKYEQKLREGGEVELLPQEEEILMADWIDMEFYAHQGTWKESPLYKEMNGAMIRAAKRGITYSSANNDQSSEDGGDDNDESHGFVAKNLPVGFRPGSNTIYVSSKL